MKWDIIKDKYPKAYHKACLWGKAEGWDENDEEGLNTFVYGGTRLLYDFFDENEIVINLFNADCLDKWGTYIFTPDIGAIQSSYKYKNRKEAEQAAFLKAFEILQNKIDGT